MGLGDRLAHPAAGVHSGARVLHRRARGLYFFTGREIWFRISGFWTRIFAVSFGMGVVSGIIMPFQFGTNWSRFTDATADVLSPLMAYEGLMAFFLEASFLGVLLFGRRLVPTWAHFFAAVMVAVGTLFSSFWILATNSWMQTPQGYKFLDGRFVPVDWIAIVFNPSFPYRLLHNVTAFYITTAFVVMGVAAWLLRRARAAEEARMMIRMALDLLILIVPLQVFLGDQHGLNTLEHQPAKVAAIEGRYDTVKPVPLTLFGIPDDDAATMRAAIEVPVLGSLILTHSWDGAIKGLKEWPKEERPPVALPFFAFRIMVGIAFIMLFVAAAGQVLRWRGRLWDSVWFLRLCQAVAPLGFTFRANPMNFAGGAMQIRRVSKIDPTDGDVLMLDLLLSTEPLQDIWETREVRSLAGRPLPLVSREGLIKLKRFRSSDQDLVDIKRLSE